MKRGEALSLDQESVLAHFGKLAGGQGREQVPARFLEIPELLIHDEMLTEAGSSAEGFWLCVAGTKEWITRLQPTQRLLKDPARPATDARTTRQVAGGQHATSARAGRPICYRNQLNGELSQYFRSGKKRCRCSVVRRRLKHLCLTTFQRVSWS
ncbi:MAG: hypothetical protein WKG07_32625 [Hymenobacter sp.]